MEELVDLIAVDSSAAEVSDKIKDILFAKATERIDNFKPEVATSMFSEVEPEDQSSSEDQE
jgi:hypothetical protein|tara:strand:+ start:75 stop:257 length:183 start_codon:yes stop_codon:yes gene_type:complete